MTDARKRIEELEEALGEGRVLVQSLRSDVQKVAPLGVVTGMDRVDEFLGAAARLLLEQTETPVAESASARPDNCQSRLMDEGKPYPRTCQICGRGPCPYKSRAYFAETPVEETGDVDYETAWKKIADYVERHWQGAGAEPGGGWLLDEIVSRSHALDDLEDKVDALAAMRPVSVDREKLAEIRARHEQRMHWASKPPPQIASDFEWLLSVLEGGKG